MSDKGAEMLRTPDWLVAMVYASNKSLVVTFFFFMDNIWTLKHIGSKAIFCTLFYFRAEEGVKGRKFPVYYVLSLSCRIPDTGFGFFSKAVIG